MAYANVPASIGLLVSRKMATLNELQTVYGMKDAYDMLEIIYIDSRNQADMEKRAARGNNH